jgi:hypothetical protein
LRLPVRQPRPEDEDLPAFQPPETSRPLATEQLRSKVQQKLIHKDVISGKAQMELIEDGGRILFSDTGMEVENFGHEVYTIREGDPLSATVHIRRKLEYQRGEWQIRIETDSKLTADANNFHLSNHLEGHEKGNRVFAKSWTAIFPRDYV